MTKIRQSLGGGELGYAGPILLIVICLLVANVIVEPSFVAYGNWAPTLDGASVVVILSMAQAVAVISGRGGIDLSVGPLAGFINAVIVVTLNGHGSPAIVLPAALGIGLASGAITGGLIAYLRLPPVVVTLATYIVYEGLTLQVIPTAGGSAPGWLSDLTGDVGPIPGMWLLILPTLLIWIALSRTAFRRNLFGVGCDERAAFTAGVDVRVTRLLAYCLAGVFAAIGGVAVTALLHSADPTVAPVYTLQSVAAVALGGVVLSGGRGGMVGAALGGAALFLANNLLSLANVNVNVIQGVYGLILLGAVALNSWFFTSSTRRRELVVAVAGWLQRGQALRRG